MKREQKMNSIRSTIYVGLFFVIFIIGEIAFIRFFSNMLEQEVEDKLNEVATQMQVSFFEEMEGKFAILNFFASSIEKTEDYHEILAQAQNREVSHTGAIGAVRKNGEILSGMPLEAEHLEILKPSFNGKEMTQFLTKSAFSDEPCILLAVPIYSGTKIDGAAYKIISGKELEQLFYAPIFNQGGFTFGFYVPDQTVILPEQMDGKKADYPILTMIYEFPLEENHMDQIPDTLKQDLEHLTIGVSSFHYQGDPYYISATRIKEITNCYQISIVPAGLINKKLQQVSVGIWIGLIILAIIFCCIYFFSKERARKNREILQKLAYYDALTDIWNFEGFKQEIQSMSGRNRQLVVFDIDEFHYMNLLMGEAYADQLLKDISQVIQNHTIEGEGYCRVKDDVFALCLYDSSICTRRIEELIEQCVNASEKMPISISCGVVHILSEQNFTIADYDCCLIAKESVKKVSSSCKVVYYDEILEKEQIENKILQNELNSALEEEQILIYLQPKVNIQTGKWVGAEALARWMHSERGMISPGKFIPIFEKTGQIELLDLYIFEQVCKQIRIWLDKKQKVLPIAVNLSRKHLSSDMLVDNLMTILEKYQVPVELVEIELTESAFFKDTQHLTSVMKQLKGRGFVLSIDDFGTGYSTLSTLLEMPVDLLKFDKSFLNSWEAERNATVITGMIQVAKKLGIKTLMEGIETKEQVELLKEVHCDLGQGYFYAKPLPIQIFEEQWVRQ